MPTIRGKIVNTSTNGSIDDVEIIGGYKVVQTFNDLELIKNNQLSYDTLKYEGKNSLTNGTPVYVATGNEKGLYRWDADKLDFVKDESSGAGGGLNEEDLKTALETLSLDEKLETEAKTITGAINEIAGGIADLLYKPISITSFGHNKGVVERGTTVTDVNLSWGTNKTPKSLTLDGVSVLGSTSQAISGLSITWDDNKTWTLKATDERNAEDTKSTSITFQNGVYYGVSTEPTNYTSAFILGLTRQLSGGKVSPITVNAGANQYIYYCVPSRFGECVFTVGVLSGGFSKVATLDFTNGSDYTEEYYIYKSNNANLGGTTVKIT